MKKALYVAVSIITAGIWISSCSDGGGGNSEKLKEDSIRIADSIAEEEAAKAQAEQARLDSLRQDSIDQEENLFLGRLIHSNPQKLSITLPKLGFNQKKKKVHKEWDEWEGTRLVEFTDYTFERNLNGRVAIFEFSNMDGGYYSGRLIIKDPQELDAFVKYSKKHCKDWGGDLKIPGDDWHCIEIEGNKIEFYQCNF